MNTYNMTKNYYNYANNNYNQPCIIKIFKINKFMIHIMDL